MGGSGHTTRSRGTIDRRSELVRTAYRVMARDGVHRVSLQKIAQNAGVSKALLLYHFGSKDAMVLEAMEWVLQATASRIRDRIAGIDDADRTLSAMLDAIWIEPEANRDFFRFYLDGVEHQARSPEFDEFGETSHKIIEGLYADVISDGMARGVFSVGDLDEAAGQVRAVIEGHFLQWLQEKDWRGTHERYRERCLRTLTRILGAERP